MAGFYFALQNEVDILPIWHAFIVFSLLFANQFKWLLIVHTYERTIKSKGNQ